MAVYDTRYRAKGQATERFATEHTEATEKEVKKRRKSSATIFREMGAFAMKMAVDG